MLASSVFSVGCGLPETRRRTLRPTLPPIAESYPELGTKHSRLTRVRGVPREGEALGVDASFRLRLDARASGAADRYPRGPGAPLHLVDDAPPTEVAGSSTNPPDPACSPSARQTSPQRLESRLTATPRTGILDRMRSLEACNPRVGDANPPVGEGGERRGVLISSIVTRSCR